MLMKLIILIVVSSFFNGVFSSPPPLQLEPKAGLSFQESLPQNRNVSNFQAASRARLPAAVIPNHYEVFLTPILDPEDADFLKSPGNVSISITCMEATGFIILHLVEIDIKDGDVTVLDSSGTEVPILDLYFDVENEIFSIALTTPLFAGQNYSVKIIFVARVADDRTDGLYLSTYTDTVTGVTNYHAATQFEAIGARKAFPCFDEPAMKATFRFALGRSETGFHTLWNTELNETLPMAERTGYVWDIYNPTPVKMSTYILAIVVSDFDSTIAPDGLYSKSVRIWGPKPMMDLSDRGEFAAKTAAKVLTFYEQYLDYPYDFPKMDSVAVPVFNAGAMENWGLNLYRTYYLLLTEGESTVLDKWRIVSVICHEIAHQWWGNLVTLKWWNDIWLNEGFANYMQFIAASNTVPEFESMERVNIETTHSALEFDAGPNSVPVHNLDIENVVLDPGQIIAEKGAALIRMMNAFLTKDTLLQGLRNYLKGMHVKYMVNAEFYVVQSLNHLGLLQCRAYRSAEQDDLFEFLDTQAHADGTLGPELTVKQIMDTWTLQSGFPLIRVSKVGDSSISVTQEKFVDNSTFTKKQDGGWHVPVGYITKSDPEINDGSLAPKFWLESNSSGTEFTATEINDWILVNPNAQCYYRVLYDEYFTAKLLKQLAQDHTMIPSLNRAELIDDYFKSSNAEYVSIQVAMELTVYMHKERSLPVWTTAFNNLRKLLSVLSETSFQMHFEEYLSNLIDGPLIAAGTEPLPNESPVTALLRTQLLDWACATGNPQCYSTASKLIAAWIANPAVNPIVTDLQPMLYCAAVTQEDNQSVWDFLVARYTASDTSSRQQTLLLNALACTKSLTKLAELINLAGSNSSFIRASHSVLLFQRIAMNQDGRPIIFEYIKNNVEPILANPRLSEAAIKTVVITLSSYTSSPETQSQLVKYLTDNYAVFSDDLKNALKTAFFNIDVNMRWIATHGPELQLFFDSTKKPKS